MATEVTVPVLGESITEATLGEWLKQPGDPVKADEPIAQPRDRQGLGRGAFAGRRRDGPACGQGRRYRAGRRDDRDDRCRRRRARHRRRAAARRARAAQLPLRRPPSQSGSDRRPAGARLRPARHARRALALGAPRGARARRRSGDGQGHRQGRPPDQGRRCRRRRSAPAALHPPRAAAAPGRTLGRRRRAAARKSASA